MSAFQAPTGTRDVLPPESARFAAVVARFAGLARTAGYGLLVSPMFEDAQVFRRGAGDVDRHRAERDVRVRGQRRPDAGVATRGNGVGRARLRPTPPARTLEGLVRDAGLPLRTAPGRALPPAPPARRGGDRHRRPGPRRRGDLARRRLPRLARADGGPAPGELDGRRRLPSRHTACCSRTSSPLHETELCDEHAKRWTANPLRVLDCKDPACVALHAAAPRLGDALCEPCRAHLDRVTAGLDAVGIRVVPRRVPRAGLRLLHPDDLRVRGAGASRPPRTSCWAAAATTSSSPPSAASPHPGSASAAGSNAVLLARDAEGAPRRGRRRGRRLRRRPRRRDGGPRPRRAAAPVGDRDRPGLRRPVDEVPAPPAPTAATPASPSSSAPRSEAAGTVTVRVLRGEGAGSQESVAAGRPRGRDPEVDR